MKTFAIPAALAVVLILPARADAQVRLLIENGLVTLEAQNVSVRQILAEWARVGGAKIVNAEKVVGAPVTLQLNAIPERQALDTILRGVAGYMLASRQAGGTGVSGFDRILILPTSSAPRAAPTPANNAGFVPRMPAQVIQPEPEVAQDDDHDEPDPDAGDEGGEEVVPQPGMNPRFQRRPNFPNPMGAPGQPFVPQGAFPGVVQPGVVEPVDEDEDAPPQTAPTNPFNVPPGASTMPGVIAPAPQQQDPRQPQTTRPRRPPA